MTSPEIIVVGGPNGSGKTTFISELIAERDLPYLGADAIAAELSPSDPGSANIAAGRELIRRLDGRLTAGESFVVETTLSGKTFRRELDRAKRLDYVIQVVFVFVASQDESVARVRERVRKGGHDVPEADIRRRFLRCLANFWRLYRPMANYWHLIDNSAETFLEVASGTPSQTIVRDEDEFARFVAIIGENNEQANRQSNA